jgi:hypothetical protein
VAEVTAVQPVQPLAAVLFSDPSVLEVLELELARALSPLDATSPIFAFDVTGYYDGEMGAGLGRVLYSFKDLMSPEEIVDIKLATNRIETGLAVGGKRRINIDPGYMDFHKLVLASAKFQGQKIYLGKGVYADPTLYYDRGWKCYSWVFPDFRDGRYDEFLTEVRGRYKAKLRRLDEGR